MIKHRHLPHVCSFRDNPIVFFTACTHKRRKLLACAQVHAILRSVWERSAERDGRWVGHYILMPDHVHFFARRAIDARPMASWMQMWKSVSSRQLSISRHLFGNRITLTGIYGYRKIMAKMELRGAKRGTSRSDQGRRRMGI